MRAPQTPANTVYPPSRTRVLFWDMRNACGWWPRLPRQCARPHCGGSLAAEPPYGWFVGQIVCLNCAHPLEGVEIHDAVPRPRRPLTDDEVNPRRGRPPKGVAT